MAGDGEKKPWDGAVGAVNEKLDGASKSARDAASDSANQVKSLVNGNVKQVKDLFGANVEQAKELTSSARLAIRRVGAQVLDGVKIAVSPVVQVFKKADSTDGTALRKQISSAREQLNEQLKDAQVRGANPFCLRYREAMTRCSGWTDMVVSLCWCCRSS